MAEKTISELACTTEQLQLVTEGNVDVVSESNQAYRHKFGRTVTSPTSDCAQPIALLTKE